MRQLLGRAGADDAAEPPYSAASAASPPSRRHTAPVAVLFAFEGLGSPGPKAPDRRRRVEFGAMEDSLFWISISVVGAIALVGALATSLAREREPTEEELAQAEVGPRRGYGEPRRDTAR
jgi:hypothetical protein